MIKYAELPKEKIKFHGKNEEERKASELIYDLSLENDSLQQEKENLIKHLEDKNKEDDIKANGMPPSSERDELITRARVYRELLERVKSGKYE